VTDMDRAGAPARVVALTSGKGGVGKTTLALALAAAWRREGLAVAVVDFDPQGGATLAAGVRPPADPLEAPPVAAHGFTLWPAGRGLAAADADALAVRLARARYMPAPGALAPDVVVVDCSPALTDALHAAALPDADPVVVVARLDAAGLPNVAEAVALARDLGRPVRVVPTFDARTGLAREALAFLRGRYGDAVTAAVIPTDARAAEAPGRGAPVLDTAPRSKVAAAVRQLAAELLATPRVRVPVEPVGANP